MPSRSFCFVEDVVVVVVGLSHLSLPLVVIGHMIIIVND